VFDYFLVFGIENLKQAMVEESFQLQEDGEDVKLVEMLQTIRNGG